MNQLAMQFDRDPNSIIFTYGMCCNALLVANSVGLLSLLEKRSVEEEELYDNELYPDSIAVKGALQVLLYGRIVEKKNKAYCLSSVGKKVVKELDVYIHWFEAYRKLLAKSIDIANSRDRANVATDFSLEEVVYSASLLKNRYVVPVLKDVIGDLKPKGTLCDLGCGSGETLVKLCDSFQIDGIGFDKSLDIVKFANRNVAMNASTSIHVYYMDYLQMKGVYPDVDLVICDFFTHHIASDETCLEVLQSFKQVFPNSRYMIFMDTVTPEDGELSPESFAPAFDYIHRLQRLETRGFSSLFHILQRTGYHSVKHIKLDVPYSYLWVLDMNP